MAAVPLPTMDAWISSDQRVFLVRCRDKVKRIPSHGVDSHRFCRGSEKREGRVVFRRVARKKPREQVLIGV